MDIIIISPSNEGLFGGYIVYVTLYIFILYRLGQLSRIRTSTQTTIINVLCHPADLIGFEMTSSRRIQYAAQEACWLHLKAGRRQRACQLITKPEFLLALIEYSNDFDHHLWLWGVLREVEELLSKSIVETFIQAVRNANVDNSRWVDLLWFLHDMCEYPSAIAIVEALEHQYSDCNTEGYLSMLRVYVNLLIEVDQLELSIEKCNMGLAIVQQNIAKFGTIGTTFLNPKGIALRRLERFDEAAEIYLESIEQSPKIVDMQNLALVLAKMGKAEQASYWYEQAMERWVSGSEELKYNWVTLVSNYGRHLHRIDDYNGAKDIFDKYYDLVCRCLPFTDTARLAYEHNFALALGAVGQLLRSADTFERVWRARELRYGESQHSTITSGFSSAITLHQADYPVRAAEIIWELDSTLKNANRQDKYVEIWRATLLNNGAWEILVEDRQSELPRKWWGTVIDEWSDSTTWKYHWVHLGLSLCDSLQTGGFTSAENALQNLIQILGEDHDRVVKGKMYIELLSVGKA